MEANALKMELASFDRLQKELENYASAVKETYRANLVERNHWSSGDLINTISYKVENNGVDYEVSLNLKGYWKYLEEGIQGKKNPASPFSNPGWKVYPFILKWIEVKPVLPKPLPSGKLPKPKQLAYLISRKIVENGTAPSKDLERALDAVNDQYRERLRTAMEADLRAVLTLIVQSAMTE